MHYSDYKKIANQFPPQLAGSQSVVLNEIRLAQRRSTNHGTGIFSYDEGEVVEYRFKGYFHRSDGPALTTSSVEIWCIDGEIHRPDGPAVYIPVIDKHFYFLNNKMYSPGMFFIMFYKNEYCTKGCHFLNGD